MRIRIARANLFSRRRAVLAAAVLVILLAGTAHVAFFAEPSDDVALVLIVPAGSNPDDGRIRVWQDAAAEEGLPLRTLSDAEFLRPGLRGWGRYAGVILPDGVYRVASDAMLAALYDYVKSGGQLMVVYDAGTLGPHGGYHRGRSRLSELVGLDYALYDEYRHRAIEWGPVFGCLETMQAMRIPPAKFFTSADGTTPPPRAGCATQYAIAAYTHPHATYPIFATRGSYSGEVLFTTRNGGLAAGYRPYGRGGVLFANLPLGYLKTETDGLLLHGFLHYFGARVLGLPRLSPSPEAVGGLVVNWHVGSNASLEPMERMKALGVFDEGPYSIDITAGPDAYQAGDRAGLDVLHNPLTQQWVRYFIARGDSVGSHGGWIHDYFGKRVNENNKAEFLPFLEMNKHALEKVTSRVVREYSAPEGNQPQWSTDWIERQGVVAYCSAGNTGLGATRTYYRGKAISRAMWAFPVLTFRDLATFEEAYDARVPQPELSTWLREVVDFAAGERSVRLIYFHPEGAVLYPQAMRDFLARGVFQRSQHRFRWYTMTGMADYLNIRAQVNWRLREIGAGRQLLEASHPMTLARQAWQLPRSSYARPVIVAGDAEVDRDEADWIVRVRSGKQLKLVLETVERKVPAAASSFANRD